MAATAVEEFPVFSLPEGDAPEVGDLSSGLLWNERENGGLGDPLVEETPKRGPKPKQEKAARPLRGTASERQLAEIGEALEEKMAGVGALLSGIAPVTSVYAVERSPRAIAALLSIAKRRPKVLAALSKAADGVDVLEIAQFAAGLVVAMQVDAGRLKGNELPAQALGVTGILEEFFTEPQEQNMTNPAVMTQAPRFVSV
jgi:hypothetical protein